MLKRMNMVLLVSVALLQTLIAATTVKIAPDKESGVYEIGQSVNWTVAVQADGKPASGDINWKIKHGGLDELSRGKSALVDGAVVLPGKRDDPGALLLEVSYKPAGANKAETGAGGAVFAPDKIVPSAPVPDDFDAFWKAKIAELKAVPANMKLTKVDIKDPKIEYYTFTMDNIRGTKIHGQLARPVGTNSLAAILQVQWAGVYALNRDWVLGNARGGWLAMNISAHDLPIDEKAEFYAEKSAKELNDYPGIGNDDREKSYFLRMFLSCYRACDAITERPDWNRKTLVVTGGSQGGYQSLVTAGFHPAVTALAACVPAGCDHTGVAAHRAPGWPNWAGRTWQGKDVQKMLSVSRYFDAVNFTSRIKVPALVGLGLIDTTCPPEGVFAAVNSLQGPKKIIIMPRADHKGDHKAYYAAFGQFLEEQKKK